MGYSHTIARVMAVFTNLRYSFAGLAFNVLLSETWIPSDLWVGELLWERKEMANDEGKEKSIESSLVWAREGSCASKPGWPPLLSKLCEVSCYRSCSEAEPSSLLSFLCWQLLCCSLLPWCFRIAFPLSKWLFCRLWDASMGVSQMCFCHVLSKWDICAHALPK